MAKAAGETSDGAACAHLRALETNRLALMTDGDWRDGGFRQRRPSVETLAWVAASMGRGSRIVGYRRLTGGVCSAVNRLTVERGGKRTFVVLRQYPGGLGLQGSLEKEIANLGVVAGSGLPVPSILAADVAGASTGGAPSLLMTRLPGHVAPQSGGTSVVDDEDRGACRIAAFPRSPREDVQTLDGFLDRSSRRVSGAGRRTEAGCVEGGVRCHGGAAAKGHCRLSALRFPAGQPAVVAREDHWTDRLERHPSGGARDRRRALSAILGGALLARVVGAASVAL